MCTSLLTFLKLEFRIDELNVFGEGSALMSLHLRIRAAVDQVAFLSPASVTVIRLSRSADLAFHGRY